MPKVSIIMNCFNGEEFLKEALNSVKDQTFTDYEIIFVDNCSTDNSAEIALSFGKKLKYFKTQANLCLGKARNFALERCTGEYIAFLDCDDMWKSEKLEKQVAILDLKNNIAMTMTNYDIINMQNNSTKLALSLKKSLLLSIQELAVDYAYEFSSYLIRASVLRRNCLIFDSSLSYATDYDLFLRMSLFGKAYYLNESLAYYRIHGSMNSKKLKYVFSAEYLRIRDNLKILSNEIKYDCKLTLEYLTFLSALSDTKVYLEVRNNSAARKCIKNYVFKSKKGMAFYLLTLLPPFISFKLIYLYYKNKAR